MKPVSAADGRQRIETQYVDAQGQQRHADPDVVARVAAAMEGPMPARRSPRSVVARPGHGPQPPLPAGRTPKRWEILSDERIAGGESASGSIELPDDLPVGTYTLKITTGLNQRPRSEAVTLLRAPPQAFQGRDDGRMWALAVQLYGVRSQGNWGHGDFTDLAMLLDLAARLGAAGIGLNPLHCLLDGVAGSASPYSPNSRLFLNPLYIDVEAVPEFPGIAAGGLERDVEEMRRRELVDYAGVARLKMAALRLAFDRIQDHTGPRRQAFEHFREERGALLARFTCFEFLRHVHAKPWWDWPATQRDPVSAVESLSGAEQADAAFFAYVQWLAEQQLEACCDKSASLGLPLGLYLDVAVGVRPEGFDAWNEQNLVLPALRIGAPPDRFNVAGQNWGLAAFNPVALEACRFEPVRALLRASMRQAGAIRIDHVLGLKRLYLIPEGLTPGEGAYVRYPFEALLAVAAQESVHHRCIIVGEDLGTVPEGLRETLADWGIWSYQVMLFERTPDGSFASPESYRANSVVTFSTHDLPTFAGWVSGYDLDAKRALGIDPGETDAERHAAHCALRRALDGRAPDFPSVAALLGATPSRLLLVAIEDALGMAAQTNMPGTIDEHPNWRRRLPVSLPELGDEPRLIAIAQAMAMAGRSSEGAHSSHQAHTARSRA